MIHLKRQRGGHEPRYPGDIDTLDAILRKNGYYAHREDIEWAWECFSSSMCAGWIGVDCHDEDYNLSALLARLEPVDPT